MKVDLHTHSYFSDGAHAPDWVVARARENGVSQLALTDHDCLDGYFQAVAELATHAPDGTFSLIPGVEISTRWQNLEIHVLALNIDPGNVELNALLNANQLRRRERLGAIEAKLIKAGITGLGDYMRGLPCTSPGRAHVARFLAGRTRSATSRKAFRSLARNGRFYVAPQWCSMEDAVAKIGAAGGIATLAHPHRYPLSRRGLAKLLVDFQQAGGEALELCCANSEEGALTGMAQLSLEQGFWVSAGSDFHTSDATWMDIGRLREIPEMVKKNAIWLHPGWHSS